MRLSALSTRERVKLCVSGGIVFIAVVLVTAAASVDRATSVMVFDGSQNRFELSMAASFTQGWVPNEGDWQSTRSGSNTLTLSSRENPQKFTSGATQNLRVAVRNSSPRLISKVSLSLADTEPSVTGAGVDALFENLYVTITDDSGTVLVSNLRASEVNRVPWSVRLRPGSHALLNVALDYMPLTLPTTEVPGGIQFQFRGESQ